MKKICLLLILLNIAFSTRAQLAPGSAAPDFRLPTADGRSVSLADYRSGPGVVLVFTSNHCPFGRAAEDRLLALDRRFSGQGVPVLALRPGDPSGHPDDQAATLAARAREKGYGFPILLDDAQTVARQYGVTRLPTVLVLRRTGDRYFVHYAGALDDSPQDGPSARQRYVDDAVTALLAGCPAPVAQTRPMGCALR